MNIVIEAVYEQGVLRPTQPLALAEGAQVRLTIVPTPAPTNGDAAPTRDDYHDPLADVIGICDVGPEFSLAQHHDDIIYGFKPKGNDQP